MVDRFLNQQLESQNRQNHILELLVRNQGRQVEVDDAQRNADLDKRFKWEARLEPIYAEDAMGLLMELDAFETQVRKVGIRTWEKYYRYFDATVKGKARSYVDQFTDLGGG